MGDMLPHQPARDRVYASSNKRNPERTCGETLSNPRMWAIRTTACGICTRKSEVPSPVADTAKACSQACTSPACQWGLGLAWSRYPTLAKPPHIALRDATPPVEPTAGQARGATACNTVNKTAFVKVPGCCCYACIRDRRVRTPSALPVAGWFLILASSGCYEDNSVQIPVHASESRTR